MKKVLLPVVFFVAAMSFTSEAAYASQSQAAGLVNKTQGVWIDVRSAAEFAAGRLQNAVNVPVNEIAGRIHGISPDKNAPIHLYCRSGSRADAALRTLKEMGYTHVVNHGGYQDLLKKGLH